MFKKVRNQLYLEVSAPQKRILRQIKMANEQSLIQYVFEDGHEEIANQDGRLVLVKDPKTDYLPLESRLKRRYVQGSTPDTHSYSISSEPKEGEHLVTGSWFLGFFPMVSTAEIVKINSGFKKPDYLK